MKGQWTEKVGGEEGAMTRESKGGRRQGGRDDGRCGRERALEVVSLLAGIMEVADILVVNKADGNTEEAARRSVVQHRSTLDLMPRRWRSWAPQASPHRRLASSPLRLPALRALQLCCVPLFLGECSQVLLQPHRPGTQTTSTMNHPSPDPSLRSTSRVPSCHCQFPVVLLRLCPTCSPSSPTCHSPLPSPPPSISPSPHDRLLPTVLFPGFQSPIPYGCPVNVLRAEGVS